MNPDFIITSDIHARETNPISRIDNYWETLKRKILWLGDVQRSYGNIPIIDSGDLFDSWKSSPMVESWLIENLPQPFFSIIGNHEMPHHNINYFEKSSLNVLVKAGIVKLLDYYINLHHEKNPIRIYGSHYGENDSIEVDIAKEGTKHVLVMHEMVIEKKTEFFESKTPEEILDKFPQFDLIICGHNHKRFMDLSIDKRIFISPGSFMRSNIDQINYQPNIYLIYLQEYEFKCEGIKVPIEEDVWDYKTIELRKQKDERIQNFVESLSTEYSVDVSFEKNIERFCENNKIRNGIKEEIYLALGGNNG